MEDVVLACLAADDVDAAIAAACAAHPQHADTIVRVAARLRDLGMRAVASSPDRLGPFDLLERLGEGGMGVVYRAWQSPPGREVALKIIRPELLHFAGSKARFRREIEACLRLAHPHIVQVLEVGSTDDVPWFSMTYVTGRSLASILCDLRDHQPSQLCADDFDAAPTRSALPDISTASIRVASPSPRGPQDWVTTVVHAILQIADALGHAHARGVVHRDVKPSNIMISADGRAQLLDFGLAWAEGAQQLTRSNTLLGSLPYLAPELLRDDGTRAPGAEVDVYSLGVTLYEALTLHSPFLGPTPEITRARILEARPDRARSRNPSIPRDLETVCAIAMADEPGRRYASVSDFARDLQRALSGEPILASREGWPRRALRFVRRNRALVASTMTIVLALSVGTAVSLSMYLRSERSRVQAEQRRDQNAWLAYVANLASAESSLRVHRVADAADRLRATRSEDPAWEWRHLVARLDLSVPSALPIHGKVRAFACASPSRAMLLDDASLAVVDLDGSATIASLPIDPQDPPIGAAISADGERVLWRTATALHDWDVVTGARREFGKARWSDVAIDPTGRHYASVTAGGQLWFWNRADLEPHGRLQFDGYDLRGITFSPSGERAACVAMNRAILVVDVAPCRVLHQLRGHRASIRGLTFDPGGRTLASASLDGTVRLWSVDSGQPIGFPLEHATGVAAIAFRANGRDVIAAAGESLTRWSVQHGTRLGTLHAPGERIVRVDWPLDDALWSLDSSGALRRWDFTAEDLPNLRPHGSAIDTVAISADARLLTSIALEENLVRVWERTTLRLMFDGISWGLGRTVSATFCGGAPSDAPLRLALVCTDRVLVLECAEWTKVCELPAHDDGLRIARSSPDGRLLATAGRAGEPLRIWNLADGAPIAEIAAEQVGDVVDLAFLPKGDALVSSGEGGVIVWSGAQFARAERLPASPAGCRAVALARDGRWLAVACESGVTRWRRDDEVGAWIEMPIQPIAGVLDVEFEPDGDRLFSTSSDGSIRVLADHGGREAARLHAPKSDVRVLAFDASGSVMLSGDDLGEMRIWCAPPVGSLRLR